MEWMQSIFLGVGLSAACGFRVFVPLLGMSLCAKAGHLSFAPGFEWMGSWPALVIFAVATVLEVLAYYIPFVDNLLDTIATPAAMIAGTIVMASQVGEVSPLLRWSLAVIVGGGAAGMAQGSTVLVRAASTATTAGAGNPVVSTGELAASAGATLLAIVLPVAAVIVVVLLSVFVLRGIIRPARARREPDPQGQNPE